MSATSAEALYKCIQEHELFFHNLDSISSLSHDEQTSLLASLNTIDWNRFHEARASVLRSTQPKALLPSQPQDFCPCEDISLIDDSQPTHLGVQKRPPQTAIGLILLAGGQATRMGLPPNTPKALVQVSPLSHKSLLQLAFEKASAYERASQAKVFIAIFASDHTEKAIRESLHSNNFYGFPPENVSLVRQLSLPFMTQGGELIIDRTSHQVMKGPDGNGSILMTMERSGVFAAWEKNRVSCCSIASIDNPLIDPFLDRLIDAVAETASEQDIDRADIAFTAVRKRSDNESVGLFVQEKTTGKICVVEYSEIETRKSALGSHSISDFIWANISQCAVSLRWAREHALKPLPWHIAHKQSLGYRYCKMEQFIFDILEYANSCRLIAIDRDRYFAPIKRKDGDDTLEAAQMKMRQRDKALFQEIITKTRELQHTSVSQRIDMEAIDMLELDPFWLYYTPSNTLSEQDIASCYDGHGYLRMPSG